LLSREGDPSHRQLPAALPHATAGRGSAFTQSQRYVSLHALETATSTSDLLPVSASPTGRALSATGEKWPADSG
jgi:hypothetical protein